VQCKAWDVVYRFYTPASAALHYNKIFAEYGSPRAESLRLTLQDNKGKEIVLSRD